MVESAVRPETINKLRAAADAACASHATVAPQKGKP